MWHDVKQFVVEFSFGLFFSIFHFIKIATIIFSRGMAYQLQSRCLDALCNVYLVHSWPAIMKLVFSLSGIEHIELHRIVWMIRWWWKNFPWKLPMCTVSHSDVKPSICWANFHKSRISFSPRARVSVCAYFHIKVKKWKYKESKTSGEIESKRE